MTMVSSLLSLPLCCRLALSPVPCKALVNNVVMLLHSV